MIAYLRDEEGAGRVADVLEDSSNECFAHSLNLREVYYDAHRRGGPEVARSALADLAMLGILARPDLSPTFWQAAGVLKSEYRRISLADCLAIVLAQTLDAELLTADHHEFDRLAGESLCRIRFVR